MRPCRLAVLACAGLLAHAAVAIAQQPSFPTDDPVIRRIWEEGMERSQVYPLSQVLADSIGPRLVGSPGYDAAADWLIRTYGSWGIPARREAYGNWRGWERGTTHIDLLQPRVRTLEGTMLAWSPGTGRPVTAPVVLLPEFRSAADFQAWLPQAKGKYVLVTFPEPTCRPDEQWLDFTAGGARQMLAQRDSARQRWHGRIAATGLDERGLLHRLDSAGVAGILTSAWIGGYGTMRVLWANTERAPALALSCEDYGLLARLAANGQGPLVRVDARAKFLGERPAYNVIAELRGTELPDETVILSAHLDSWDAGSGATDNGTGTVIMAEAMRILKAVYPNPRRTIIAGHWGSEEQGLNGSRAFVADHPGLLDGIQAVFNQDNGTGRIARISAQGFIGAGEHLARWFSRIPDQLTAGIDLTFPGNPGGGGSDYASFVCAGIPAFGLGSASWDYFAYTWHTNRDTFDKVSIDDVRANAVLTAMLVYLAAEDPERVPRDRRIVASRRTGEPGSWPACSAPARSSTSRFF